MGQGGCKCYCWVSSSQVLRVLSSIWYVVNVGWLRHGSVGVLKIVKLLSQHVLVGLLVFTLKGQCNCQIYHSTNSDFDAVELRRQYIIISSGTCPSCEPSWWWNSIAHASTVGNPSFVCITWWFRTSGSLEVFWSQPLVVGFWRF